MRTLARPGEMRVHACESTRSSVLASILRRYGHGRWQGGAAVLGRADQLPLRWCAVMHACTHVYMYG